MQNVVKKLSDYYIVKDGKRLYYGYTTGSCGAGAAKAAAMMLFTGEKVTTVHLMTPKGIPLKLMVLDIQIQENQVSCAIRKYAGDDPDATDGMLIYATVTKEAGESNLSIDGGTGIGRVTRSGLDQPIGNAAINRVPREMIEKEVREICKTHEYFKGIKVLIEAPKGYEVAKKTFNPRLGIVGGISILGTSGIVVPMSEEALIKTIETEMRMHLLEGEKRLLITPGNYGEDFVKEQLKLDVTKNIHCSNYVGKTIDLAVQLGAKEILFVSHIGKFIKVAGGIMDTHSKNADCRAEILAACAIRAGGNGKLAGRILDTQNTEEALTLLKDAGILKEAMKVMMERIGEYVRRRAGDNLEVHVIVYSFTERILGEI